MSKEDWQMAILLMLNVTTIIEEDQVIFEMLTLLSLI